MRSSLSFEKFISEKPLYYKEIDHNRVKVAYERLKPHIRRPLTIHVVGTNGKGSTGRIMATLLHSSGKRVGHFSSPHILKFNERIWIEGEDSSDEILEEAHQKLYQILGQEQSEGLSYFEYTTLLAFVATERVDVMILEAGLGGEFDATNVVAKELSVITPIGIDHQAFLGDNIESIARTKLNSVEQEFLLGLQVYDEVYTIAEEIAQEKGAKLNRVTEELDKKLWDYCEEMGWADYLYENAKLAITALEILNLPYTLESIREVQLFGRFYPLLPNVTIDVGHNLLATKRVVKALDKRFPNEEVILVYNGLDDKDYEGILEIFKNRVSAVEILEIETQRATNIEDIYKTLDKLNIQSRAFSGIDSNHNYLVFGSFYLIESFLKEIKYNK